MNDSMEAVFGPVISSYSRAQAIADGGLVDVSQADGCKGVFKFPVALTRAAWAATVEAGGRWGLPAGAGGTWGADGQYAAERLLLPGGQSVAGRLHDVCWMLCCGIRARQGRCDSDGQRVNFSVLVDRLGNGRRTLVELCSVCGPGDNGEPVITIMLRNED